MYIEAQALSQALQNFRPILLLYNPESDAAGDQESDYDPAPIFSLSYPKPNGPLQQQGHKTLKEFAKCENNKPNLRIERA